MPLAANERLPAEFGKKRPHRKRFGNPVRSGSGREKANCTFSPYSRRKPMLVLTRKINEHITIDGDIEIVVLSVAGHRVKLGIVADADKPIRRTMNSKTTNSSQWIPSKNPTERR
jgi:carbon storage regulator CsrA